MTSDVQAMRLQDLLSSLRQRGVELWEQDQRLRFRAPEGALDDTHRAAMRHHRDALLAYVRDPAAQQLVPDRAALHEPFPLTVVQSAYLLGRREGIPFGGVGCHAYLELALPTVVDPTRVREAMRQLVERHAALRTVFHPEGQQVLASVPELTVPVRDLREQSDAGVERALADIRTELDHRIYDPAAWPLFELHVTRLAEQTRLHLSIDLLVADFAGVQQLMGELEQLCFAPATALVPLDVSYRDYVVAEQRARQSARHERDRAYWIARDLPPAPELPRLAQAWAREPAAVRFQRHQERLTPGAAAALRRRARHHDLTPSTVLLAAYADVIAAWSETPRFTLNLPVFRRWPWHPRIQEVVGDFTTVTLLSVESAPEAAFVDRARVLGAQLFEALEHGSYSGVELLRENARRSGTFAAGLMPVVFTSTLTERAGAERELARPTQGRVVYGATQTPQVWIDCQVTEVGGELLLSWDVRQGVFPAGMIDDAFGAFVALVRRLSEQDDAWGVRDPGLLPEAQQTRRREMNQTAAPLPEGLLHTRVLVAAKRHAQQPAVFSSERTLTYGALLARAHSVLRQLADRGIGRGERVAVVMDKGWAQVPAVLGVLLAGATYVPIDTVHPAVRREQMLRAAGCVAILTTSRLVAAGTLPQDVPHIAVDSLEDASAPEAVTSAHASEEDAAYVIFTSGSTGAPKGVVVSHRAALNTVVDINRRFHVGPSDRVLGLAQLGFDLSVYDIFGVLAEGGCLVLPDADRRSDPSHWVELIARHGVTLWNSVPAPLQMLHDYLEGPAGRGRAEALGTLRLGLLSGDWIPVPLPDRIRALLPNLSLVSLGGATEAAIWSIFHPIEQPVPDQPSILYGRPLTNQTFHVLDVSLRPRPDWVPGELYIGGAGLALGYLEEAQTRERFRVHPVSRERLYRTGDRGRYLPSGDIEFLGRRDQQVKLRGHRVELAEIETALLGHPATAGAAVVVVGDGLARQLAGFVELATTAGSASDLAATLRSCTREANDEPGAEVDRPRVEAFVRALDAASRASMLAALRARGLFANRARAHQVAEITSRAAARHAHVVRRWLDALAGDGLLAHDASGGYRLDVELSTDFEEVAWRRLSDVWTDAFGSRRLLAYLRANAARLPELLTGELEAVQLLFPEGQLETADAAYADNVMSRYLNRVVAEVMRAVAEHLPATRALQILEVGAGTGATTREILRVLGDTPCAYVFTDVGPFFLNQASQRFGGDERVTCRRFDIDQDARAQGFSPNSFDVVIAAGVLNNARDIGAALASIRTLLRPGGRLVLTDPTREHDEILISQAFMMTQPEDVRGERDTTFLELSEWHAALREAGGRVELCLPGPAHVLAPLGQHVFCVCFKEQTASLDVEMLRAHLSERLPDYMVPQRLELLDALPLTQNGKVDRTQLEAWARSASVSEGQGEADLGTTRDELETRLSALWSQALRGRAIAPRRSLFELGADSLIIAQVAARLIERLPEAAGQQFDTLLREILNRPTVAELASYLRRSGEGGAANTRSSGSPGALVWLQGSEGAVQAGGPALHVLVHEGIGTMAPYRELAAELEPATPVVGLVVGDVEAYLAIPADSLLAHLAAEHARALTALGARRFRITGYCLGGQLATEIARQLTEAGADVEQLTVVSSSPPAFVIEDELLIEHAFAKVLGVDLARAGYVDDDELLGRALRRILEETPGRVRANAFAALREKPGLELLASQMEALALSPQAARLGVLQRAVGAGQQQGSEAEHIPGLYQVFRHAFAAASLHTCDVYAGDVTVVRPSASLRFLVGFERDYEQYWRNISLGDIHVVDVGGDHFSCMRAPHVTTIASLLTGAPG